LNQLFLAILETPDFDYIKKDTPAVNSLILLDKDTIETCHVQDLRKEELGNCLLTFEKTAAAGESRLS